MACPYGRLQSVLLDRRSLIVGYDPLRGEPRAHQVKDRPAGAGDCIDCGACVLTCPTGIDIRDGLQMECIHCTQCIDACDAVMDKVGKPRGPHPLHLPRRGRGQARPACSARASILYPAALVVARRAPRLSTSARKADTDVTLLRGAGAPFTRQPDGSVVNQVRVKIANRDARRAPLPPRGDRRGRARR